MSRAGEQYITLGGRRHAVGLDWWIAETGVARGSAGAREFWRLARKAGSASPYRADLAALRRTQHQAGFGRTSDGHLPDTVSLAARCADTILASYSSWAIAVELKNDAGKPLFWVFTGADRLIEANGDRIFADARQAMDFFDEQIQSSDRAYVAVPPEWEAEAFPQITAEGLLHSLAGGGLPSMERIGGERIGRRRPAGPGPESANSGDSGPGDAGPGDAVAGEALMRGPALDSVREPMATSRDPLAAGGPDVGAYLKRLWPPLSRLIPGRSTPERAHPDRTSPDRTSLDRAWRLRRLTGKSAIGTGLAGRILLFGSAAIILLNFLPAGLFDFSDPPPAPVRQAAPARPAAPPRPVLAPPPSDHSVWREAPAPASILLSCAGMIDRVLHIPRGWQLTEARCGEGLAGAENPKGMMPERDIEGWTVSASLRRHSEGTTAGALARHAGMLGIGLVFDSTGYDQARIWHRLPLPDARTPHAAHEMVTAPGATPSSGQTLISAYSQKAYSQREGRIALVSRFQAAGLVYTIETAPARTVLTAPVLNARSNLPPFTGFTVSGRASPSRLASLLDMPGIVIGQLSFQPLDNKWEVTGRMYHDD